MTHRFSRFFALVLFAPALFALPPKAMAGFADSDDGRLFIREMYERHGFDPAATRAALARAKHEPRVIRLIRPPTSPAARSWQRYRDRFLDAARIHGGLAFWQENEAALRRAEELYGVPAEIITAIIGVETVYGRQTGSFETLSALATLAFDYPPRAALFRRELAQLFLLAREQERDLASYHGSYAGALGMPQFLPSSVRHYAVDFDGDGRIDFDDSPADAIGSVAHYLRANGWERGGAIAQRARLAQDADPAPLIAAGIEPALTAEMLAAAGIGAENGTRPEAAATLVDLETPGAATEYWLGYRNFYAITRYNKSSFYAMSVYLLGETLRERRARQTARAPQ